MNVQEWITNVNNIDKSFLHDKHHLLKFISLCPSKYLTLAKLPIPNNVKNMLNNSYVLIWDCEFQIFDPLNKIKCNNIFFENKLIRCISELGVILLFRIHDVIYIAGLFHCSFFNHLFSKIENYMPFYHEYLSTNQHSEQKIINLENRLYPHLIFMKAWNQYMIDKDIDALHQILNSLLNNKLIRTNKHIYKKFKEQITSLDHNKINGNLKNIIYSKLIKDYRNSKLFKKIYNIYIHDPYIVQILVDVNNHRQLINSFIQMVKQCLNIVKGMEDIKALNNHGLLYDRNCISHDLLNIDYIDIADYNEEIHFRCASAKLYESYICLMRDVTSDWHSETNTIMKTYMSNDMKPHNPLVDAYYTLSVFIQFNSQ